MGIMVKNIETTIGIIFYRGYIRVGIMEKKLKLL